MTKSSWLRSKPICRTSTARNNDGVRGGWRSFTTSQAGERWVKRQPGRRSTGPRRYGRMKGRGSLSERTGAGDRGPPGAGPGCGSPGFRRHRDETATTSNGLPSTAIQRALLPAIRHDIHRVWLDRTRSAMVSICRDRGPCGCRYNNLVPRDPSAGYEGVGARHHLRVLVQERVRSRPGVARPPTS